MLYGRNPCDEAMYDLDVHGGITFAEFVGDEFYLGFDMAHAFDIEYVWSDPHIKCIRTDQECIDETDHLAEQIAELGATGMWSKLKLWWMKRHRDRGRGCSDDACQNSASAELEERSSSKEKYPLGTAIITTGEELLLKNR